MGDYFSWAFGFVMVYILFQTWGPSAFSTCLIVKTETSMVVTTKSCCRSFAVSQGLLATCLLMYLVAAVGGFIFLPQPAGVANNPLTINLMQLMKPLSGCLRCAFETIPDLQLCAQITHFLIGGLNNFQTVVDTKKELFRAG
ncbi:hypothetical protein ATANTOWER_001434 [Ataeniobius toweri]|uniref:Uncharacterized protein n=1 Tax=Ataeniobius toweri TaxID=208326 RepID=A0ABU7BDB8_9TELE|nr:hypothetical protein [Ataeniobius toweri]